jgi:deoxycytidylate deaminase/dephospho-CoA kinase
MPVAKALQRHFERRSSLLIVGFTGRTGSGCSTSAKLLGSTFQSLNLDQSTYPLETVENRKYRITREYAEQNWESFYQISVTQVIATFIFDCSPEDLERSFVVESLKERDRSAFIIEFKRLQTIWRSISPVIDSTISKSGREKEIEEFLRVWSSEITNFANVIKKSLGSKFSPVFQKIGDNLRSSGSALDSCIEPNRFYVLPARVCEIAVAIRHLNECNHNKTHVVIDALRNPFEIQYYRDRFAHFYLVAVTTDDDDRIDRLSVRVNLNNTDIKKLDSKEYPSENKPLDGYSQFVSQNIQACLEKADIFIHNPGRAKEGQLPQLSELTQQLVRFVTLMLHPGLVTPTRIERCMQIAYSAKVNSGCISRQVGAAVTDEHFSVKSVGWNDVPEGQVPCLLRKAEDLVADKDGIAFSEYEVKTIKFREHIKGSLDHLELVHKVGLGTPYCFKSKYNALEHPNMKGGNQVHTRSLHAEENAFLQLSKYGGSGIVNGILFTTASPCELCAKKAYQLGIREIYYIDPYPGISMSHILGSGPNLNRRPRAILFSGAVGQAFHRVYSPLLPFKDELSTFMKTVETEGSESVQIESGG